MSHELSSLTNNYAAVVHDGKACCQISFPASSANVIYFVRLVGVQNSVLHTEPFILLEKMS